MSAETIHHCYLHIPFCPTKCHYCAFVTHVGSMRLAATYVSALEREIDGFTERGRSVSLDTVYVGGGTPSMLEPALIARLLDRVCATVHVAPDAEISMEAHPDTIDERKLAGFHAAGVTRISFGVESLNEGELRRLGRTHGAGQALRVLALARQAGFASVNLDLMYGLPGQTLPSWQESLWVLAGTEPDHISLYPLMIEPKTVFARRTRMGQLHVPGDDAVAEMYAAACDALRTAGYTHYEVANWAKPGHECRHNLAYWRDCEYFGAGVGAHAYLKPFRTENMRGVRRYVETIDRGESPVVHRETVDSQAELSEYLTLGLRLLDEGLDLHHVARRFGSAVRAQVETQADPLVHRGLMRREGDALFLEEWAAPVGNEVWERFISLDAPEPAAV